MDSFRYLTSYKEIGDFISNLQDDVNNKAVKDFKKQLEQEFADIKSGIETEVEKYINKMELNSAEKDVRKETIRDKIEEYEIDLDIADYKAPQFATDQFAGVAKGIGETLINAMRNPQFSFPFFIGILLVMFIRPLMSKVPLLGDTLASILEFMDDTVVGSAFMLLL